MDRRVQALRAIERGGREDFLATEGLRTQAERHLQLAIQCAIDVAVHILAEDSTITPEDYGSAFVALAEMDVLNTDLADRLRLAAGLRNVLVHAYTDVDPERVWTHLSRLEDLEAFAAAVERYLTR
jgi:uncharacterized protein YutE (UPF0331/DUF86 family)